MRTATDTQGAAGTDPAPDADHTGDPASLSVVVLARNEAVNLPRCLDAAAQVAAEIVVIDDFSTDDTRAVAEAHGARVCRHRFETFAAQRNWSMANGGLQGDWVLHLDADEEVTPELATEIRSALATAGDDVAGFLLPFKTMLGGRWLRHSSAYPVWVARLVRPGRVRFAEQGHGETYEAEGEIGKLREPFLHHNFSKGLTEWFDRHNRYSCDEAAASSHLGWDAAVDWRGLVSGDPVRRRRALKVLSRRLPARPWLKFAYMYFLRMGFLDGSAGLTYCALQAIYEYMICLKVRELRRERHEASIQEQSEQTDEPERLAPDPGEAHRGL